MKILAGRAGTGKTTALLETIKNRLAESRQILIVPELFSHEYERLLAQAAGNQGGRNAEVLTFRRIVNRVFSEVGGLCETALSPAGRLLVLHEALLRAGESLTVFTGAADKPDLLKAMLHMMDELKVYCVEPSQLLFASAGTEGTLSGKLRDVGLIAMAYQKLTEEDLPDPREELDKLALRLPQSTMFNGACVYFDSFSGFSPQEMRIMELLVSKKVPLTFAFTCDMDEPALFPGSFETIGALARIAKKHGQTCEITKLKQGRAQRAGGLAYLEQSLLCPDAKPNPDIRDGVTLCQASTAFQECEQAAAYIRSAVRKGQGRWRDFVIAARDITPYLPSLEMVCQRYDIPIFMSEKKDLLSKPVLALVTGALETVAGGFRQEDLFGYLKTGLGNITLDECDELENYAVLWRLRGSAWAQDFRLNPDGFTGVITEEGKEKLAHLNTLRAQAMQPLLHLSEALKASRTAAEYVQALYEFLMEVGAGERIAQRAAEHEEAGRPQLAQEYRQLWEILVTAMEQFAWVQGDSRMDADVFAALFRLVLSEYDVGTIPVSMDRVSCGSIDRVCNKSVRHLILLGVNDGLFPRTPEGDGILSDSERKALADFDITLAPTAAEQMMLEQEVIYQAISRPAESLFLLWHRYASDGAECRPSFLIETIRRLLPNLQEWDGALSKLEAPKPCFDAACCGAGGQYDAAAGAAFSYYKSDPRLKEALGRGRIKRGPLKNRKLVEALYGKQLNLTASRVDQYYTCPFAYFCKFGLHARRRAPAAFDAPEAGTFLHYVLENVLSYFAGKEGGIRKAGADEVKKAAREFVRQYVDTMLGGLEDKTARFRYLFRRLAGMVEKILDNILYELKNSDFEPLDFELAFAQDGDLPPVALSIGGGSSVLLSGKVDRVDGYIRGKKLYLRVMDYKSGKKSFELSDLWHGLNMQLLIYLFALESEGLQRYRKRVSEEIDHIIPAGALYVPAREAVVNAARDAEDETIRVLQEKELRRSGILLEDMDILQAMENGLAGEGRFIPVKINKSGEPRAVSALASLEKLGRLAEHIRKKLREMGQEVLSGQVDAAPYYRNRNSSVCDWCDYKKACLFDRAAGERPRYLYPVKPDDFWQAIGGGQNGNKMD